MNNNNVEYQIYIGCIDNQLRDRELVSEDELRDMVSSFFERNKIDFSILSAKGGYLHDDGWFVRENTLCISIIGSSDIDIIKLAKNLSMYMNQENAMVVKEYIQTKFE